MIRKAIDFLVDDISKHNNYSEVQSEQIKYILTIICYEIVKIILLLSIFLFLGLFKECLLIIIYMIFTKPFTGGYHENTQFRCFIASLVILIFIITISKGSMLSLNSQIVLSIIIIFCLYNRIPVINERMPLTRVELIRKNKRLGIVISSLFLLLSIITYDIKWFSQTIIWTSIVQTMLLFNKYVEVSTNEN